MLNDAGNTRFILTVNQKINNAMCEEVHTHEVKLANPNAYHQSSVHGRRKMID